jgi:hypothetical protein
MHRLKCLAPLLLGLVSCLAGLPAAAQVLPQRPPSGAHPKPEGEVKNIKLKGTIKGIRGDVFLVANAEGGQWVVKMPAAPNAIHYVGTAVPAWLKPGMLVRFSGMFDSQGTAHGPIERLEVFTYRPPREGQQPTRPGVFAEAAIAGADLFADPNAAAADVNPSKSFVIIGQLRGRKDEKLVVAAGPTVVHVPLSPEAEIAFDLAEYRLAQLGDEIELSGWHYPLIKTQVYANYATIRAAEPIGKGTAKPAAVPNTGPAAAKPTPKKSDNADLPF